LKGAGYIGGNEMKEKIEGERQISNVRGTERPHGGRDRLFLLEWTWRSRWIYVMHDGSQSNKTTNQRL